MPDDGFWTDARVRRAGLAAVAGGILWVVPYGTFGAAVPLSVAGPVAVGVPTVLLSAGILGFRARYRGVYGRWGRWGLWTVLAGLVLFGVGGALLYQFPEVTGGEFGGSIPAGAWVAIAVLALGTVATALGGVALGVALYRRRIGPRPAGPLMAGQVLTFALTDYLAAYEVPGVGRSLDLFLSMSLFGAAWILLGYHLYAGEGGGSSPTPDAQAEAGGGESGRQEEDGDHPGSP